jgi:DNA-binding MarR family transcriptional regulator
VENSWLPEAQKAACRSIIRTASLLLSQLDRDLEKLHEVSLAEFDVLVALAEGPPEGVRMTSLAEMSLLSKSRLSHCVDRLEKKGCVQREKAPNDRRGLLARLTDAGSALVREIAPTHAMSMQRYLVDLLHQAELSHVAELSGRVSTAIEEARGRKPSTDRVIAR